MRSGSTTVVVLLVVACSSCGDEGPVSTVQNFVNLGQQTETKNRAPVDLGALDGLRERRLDVEDPERARIDAVLEVPIATPADRALARAEAAVRALAAEGQAIAVRVVVVPEQLPAEVGAIAVATAARDGKGWSGTEMGYRSSQVLARTAVPPGPAEVLLAAAVAQAPGADAGAKIQAAATVTGTPPDRVQAAWEAVRQYLGPLP